MLKKVSKNFKKLHGEIVIPSDKSISHRAVMFASLAKGKSVIKNFSKAQDPHSSLDIVRALGCNVTENNGIVEIISSGLLKAPQENLYCGNSGTTMRMVAGILARQNFNTVLTGDDSLSKRPMKRIIEPLTLMGAKIKSNNFKAPLEIIPSKMSPIEYKSKISSAQVKSCVLLAGLGLDGITTFEEPYISRNHTEIMLKNMGANISTSDTRVQITKSTLEPIETLIPGDISSAAYFMVGGSIIKNSDIIIKDIGLNPTRTGIIEIIKQMGGDITILDRKTIFGEDIGDVRIKYSSDLEAIEIGGEIIPKIIDEIPVIALLATQAQGQTVIKDAQDLRNKESDRIKAIVTELKNLGADIEETEDGMIIQGKTDLKGGVTLESYCDHRIAMTLYIAGLISQKEIAVENFEWINISFPEFEELFETIKI